jgi:hypothetical protein
MTQRFWTDEFVQSTDLKINRLKGKKMTLITQVLARQRNLRLMKQMVPSEHVRHRRLTRVSKGRESR